MRERVRDISDLTITFPGEASEEYERVKSGKRINFTGKDGFNYALTIVEINYESISVRIDLNSN